MRLVELDVAKAANEVDTLMDGRGGRGGFFFMGEVFFPTVVIVVVFVLGIVPPPPMDAVMISVSWMDSPAVLLLLPERSSEPLRSVVS